jgi:hypothetical protein
MAKKSNLLIELEAFLSDNPNAAEDTSPKNRADFIRTEPSTLVRNKKATQPRSEKKAVSPTILSITEQIQLLATEKECSFAEVWLDIIKQARKQKTELLPTDKKQFNKWIKSVAKQINKIKK